MHGSLLDFYLHYEQQQKHTEQHSLLEVCVCLRVGQQKWNALYLEQSMFTHIVKEMSSKPEVIFTFVLIVWERTNERTNEQSQWNE